MIKKYKDGKFVEYSSLLEALGIEEKNPILSVVGAGGKTTTIAALAGEYRKRHVPVLVTTTTHMKIEEAPWFVLEPSMEKVRKVLDLEGMAWVGIPDKDGKMKAPSGQFLEHLIQLGVPVLIEADGSKRLPLKAPAAYEPVLLKETTHVLSLYGLDAVGKTIEEVCFRPTAAAGLLGKSLTEKVSPGDILDLALDAKGGKKGILPTMKYILILNKADTREREHFAAKICGRAAMQGISDILVTAYE